MAVKLGKEEKLGDGYFSWDLEITLDPKEVQTRLLSGMREQISAALKEVTASLHPAINEHIIIEAAKELAPSFARFARTGGSVAKEAILHDLSTVQCRIEKTVRESPEFVADQFSSAMQSIPNKVLGQGI